MARCRLHQPFYLWCIGLAAQSQFDSLPCALEKLLRSTFSGWCQTRVCEKANKVLRDHETLASTSKASQGQRKPPSIYLTLPLYLPTYPYLYLAMELSIYLSAYLSTCPQVYLPIHVSIFLSLR